MGDSEHGKDMDSSTIWARFTAKWFTEIQTYRLETLLLGMHLHFNIMGLLPGTWNCGLRMRRECRERFLRHSRLAIPTCITARASRTRCDAYRDRYIGVSIAVGGGENVRDIPGACVTRNFTYLASGQWF